MSKIINLFGGPGVGKSSIASGLTYKLKKKHITCDNPYEFPKLLAWDENHSAIKDQLYVLANQHRGIVKSYGKVDFIILDSPILLSLVYKNYYKSNEYPATLYGESFDKMVIDVFNQYQNINIFLKRSDESNHNKKERYQDLTESKELDNTIQSTLDKWNVPYCIVDVGDDAVSEILKLIISK
jgi:tRNA uridine 5-carbamoylmethylation protein Kti12